MIQKFVQLFLLLLHKNPPVDVIVALLLILTAPFAYSAPTHTCYLLTPSELIIKISIFTRHVKEQIENLNIGN